MQRNHAAGCAPLWLVLTVAAQAHGDEQAVTVASEKYDHTNRPRIEVPGVETSFRARATFSATVPEGSRLDATLGERWLRDCRYAEIRTRNRRIVMFVSWDGEAGAARFGLDQNGDGEVAPGEVVDAKVVQGNAPPSGVPRARLYMPNIVTILGRPWGILVERGEDGQLTADLTTSVAYRRGAADFGGESHTLIVLDQDDDDRFASAGDLFAFFPTRLSDKIAGLSPASGPIYPVDEAALLGDRAARLREMDENGSFTLVIEPAGDVPSYLRRRTERALSRWLADPANRGFLPKEGQPAVPWIHAPDAPAALEHGRKQGRPVLIYWDEDFNELGRMMDVRTFTDPLVVDAAAAFVCVRVNCGVDLSLSSSAYGFFMGPAFTFATPEGRALQFWDRKRPTPIGNHRQLHKLSPGRVAEELRAALQRLQKGEFDAPPRPEAPKTPAEEAGDIDRKRR
jgi:hypothetical protein